MDFVREVYIDAHIVNGLLKLSLEGVVPQIYTLYSNTAHPEYFRFSFTREYIKGSSLRKSFSTIPDSKLGSIYSRIGMKLNLVKEENIVHNDLHSGNIILREEDCEPFIIDWEAGKYSNNSETDINILLNSTFNSLRICGRAGLFKTLENNLLKSQ